MKDREFLLWIHDRLEYVHKESPLSDYMHKLRAIIHTLPAGQETGCLDQTWANSMELRLHLLAEPISNVSSSRPPLGLRPRRFAVEARMVEIIEAVGRYRGAGKEIPVEWIDEWVALFGEWRQQFQEKETA